MCLYLQYRFFVHVFTVIVDNEEDIYRFLINFYAAAIYDEWIGLFLKFFEVDATLALRLEIWQAAASLKEVMEKGEMDWDGFDKHDECICFYIFTVLCTAGWHTHIYNII